MYIRAYFHIALRLTAAYHHELPLTAYLKNYFSEHKKHGSRDRKYISHFCYCFYRTGNLLNDCSPEEKLAASIFLCTTYSGQLSVLFNDDWKEAFSLPPADKLFFIQNKLGVQPENIFPLHQHLSDDINKDDFITSHLLQPDLFLRIRPGYKESVLHKLQKENVGFLQPAANCIQLAASFKADQLFTLDKEVAVQDVSSQNIVQLLSDVSFGNRRPQVWDACAGSGGKSLLLHDAFEDIHITATDVRSTIIHNLQQRFKQAGIKNFTADVEDVSHASFTCKSQYDLIICDVPCSGSGTWGRTPEQLTFFKAEQIEKYQSLQKKITGNAARCLKPGAYLLYITCSVFVEENEKMTEWMQQHLSLKLLKQTFLKGYNKKADTMFAALFSAL